ncbi:phosphoribosylformylglycinamidine synthase, purS protein [Anoxybacter fermentans]|uniref:Phosphoribosylformylglycinamidine synthase subunit PurS n=1 Tax=Anoxybacter fermentans TaxID=1323375 RepID=A0A3S9T151_9FIRM|nr:phosphoribosylformylglycinamidine synthase subunit PurS [Anoxybacter fermentans]AZR74235.1 phosphoribosylformylglycinamidine synthase, purS protein [Anoxybacter fermentans]
MFRVELKIMPRKGILNPESSTVTRALKAMGYDKVKGLEIGKFMEFVVNLDDVKTAEAYVEEICKRLLANPVIEDYIYEIFPLEEE